MDNKRMVRAGLGGTVATLLVASCPVQLAVLGALGLGAATPWVHGLEPVFYLAVAVFSGLSIYGLVRMRRGRGVATAK